jgi:hypothetical protein
MWLGLAGGGSFAYDVEGHCRAVWVAVAARSLFSGGAHFQKFYPLTLRAVL